MEFEDILADVGGYGKYQKNLVFLFTAPVTIILPMIMLSNIFIVSVPKHWCYVPQVEELSNNISDVRRLFIPVEDPSCRMYDINYENISSVINPLDVIENASTIPCIHGWVYDKSNYESTAATKWNLVCENSQYTSLILTLQNVGGILGSPISSTLSDKYGRKIVYFLIVLLSVIVNFVSPFVQDFSTFAALRLIYGAIYPPILILPYILAMELIPSENRTSTSYIWNFSWVVGMCILPAVVYLSGNWRVLSWITSSVGAMVLIYWNIVSESPRWLTSQKRYENAKDVILKVAKKNGCKLNPKSLLRNLEDIGQKIDQEKNKEKQRFYSLIKQPRLRKHFLILIANCFANHTIYCIITYNISSLKGNEFVNFFLLAIAEAPGLFLLWFTMERIGRRWSAVGGYIIAGLACAIPVTGLPHSDIVSSVVAKFIASGLYMVTDQQLCELFPTPTRSFSMGIAKSISFALAFYQPYVIQLNVYGKSLPFVVISLTCFITSIIASFLPETLNENLPQTVEDAEKIGKDQKYFSFHTKNKS